MPDPIVNQGGAPVEMGPVGFWLDKDGNVAATDMQGNPQETPGMRDNPSSKIYYDATKDLNYNLVNGKKLYQSPAGVQPGSKGSGHGMSNPGSSLMKTGGTWNPESGTFDQGTNWSNILSMVAAGVITMGAATAIMGSAAPAAEAAAAGVDTTGATGAGAGLTVAGADGGFGIPAGLATVGTDSGDLAGVVAGPGIGGVSGIGGAGSTLSTAQKIAQILGGTGKAVGDATTAAGNNALDQEKLALEAAKLNQAGLLGTNILNLDSTLGTEKLNLEGLLGANNSNISGQLSFEAELMNRAKEEASQRNSALKDTYLASATDHPQVSPYDPAGAPQYSDQYKSTIHGLADQGANKLSKPGQYDTNNMPGLNPYKPITAPTYAAHTFGAPPNIDIKNVQGATGTKPGIGQQIGNWVGPGLSVAELIAKYWS